MNNDILMRIIELFTGILLEGIILGFIFQMISSKAQETQQKELQNEMYKIESQNRHNTELILTELKEVKHDVIHEVNELQP